MQLLRVRPTTAVDKVFSFIRKAAASLNESDYERDKRLAQQIEDPVRRARILESIEARLEKEMRAANAQEVVRLQKLEKYNEKRQRSLDKYREKLERKYGKR